MYTLMNKNEPLIDFEFAADEAGSLDVKELKEYNRPWFVRNLKTWLDKRHAPKHRAHIEKLLLMIGLRNTKSMIDFSKGLSLTDTLWVNIDDKYQWDKINLFDNQFDEVIARIAFDGGMHGEHFSTTSPELTTDGAFAKCWVRDNGDIVLIKQGSSGASNAGLEPYSEQYCSEILDILGYNHVQYSTVMYHDKIASKCKLLTSKDIMMLPMAQCVEDYEYSYIRQYCAEHNMLDSLYEMVVFDYLVTNDDRHLNNVGVLLDPETFDVISFAPIFDNGAGLLPYAVDEHLISYRSLCKYSAIKGPRFYDEFFPAAQFALKTIDSEPVRRLVNFSFKRDYQYQLPETRLLRLEEYVRNQASNLLCGEDPLNIVREDFMGPTDLF